jgi:hypothetical protein
VNTPSQFDKAVSKAFVSDKFRIIRRAGVLDCKQAWEKWLAYSRFGSTRHKSSEAQAQGGRQEEPMCMHFFLGKEPENQGKTLMQYKYREDDKYWIPYDSEGIPCFSPDAPAELADLLKHPGIREPRPWPERDSISSYLEADRRLSTPEKEEWRAFFMCAPTSLEDLCEDQLFEWKLPDLARQFKEAKYGPTVATPPLGDGLGDSPRPEQPDERIIWSKFTAADARREAKVRADNYQSQQRAYSAKQAALRSSQTRQEKRSRPAAFEDAQDDDNDDDDDDDDDDSDSDEEECLVVEDIGTVFIGDVMLFSPDETSRAVDVSSGYKLGLNIGQVCALDQKKGTVQLWWFFSSSAVWSLKTMFVPWRDKKTHEPYKDWVEASLLLQDSWGALVKLQLTRVSGTEGFGKYSLSKDSYQAVQGLLNESSSTEDE